MSVFFTAVGIRAFRSFPDEYQILAPLTDVNIIVGPNNSGKSNVLNAVELLVNPRDNNNPGGKPERAFDVHEGSSVIELGYGMSLHDFLVGADNNDRLQPVLQYCHDWSVETYGVGMRWFQAAANEVFQQSANQVHSFVQSIKFNNYRIKAENALGYTGGVDDRSLGNQLFHKLNTKVSRARSVRKLSAVRRIERVNISADFVGDREVTGAGIIQRLHVLQDPPSHQSSLLEDFEKFTEFVREVLENPTAEVRVVADRTEIVVRMDGKRHPLEALGTGIQQVILIGAAVTIIKHSVFLMEEPELHLHPTLQRKLIRYLERTENQYFITTHSSHIIDTPKASVFGVTLKDGASRIHKIECTTTRWQAALDLGCRPSDIVQANSVIWVEGPSDRIYLNSWLSHKAPHLIEGVHYSVMWYGGSNLASIAMENDTLEDLVSLLPLNRSSAVLLDSDRDKASSKLKRRAERIKQECADKNLLCWVTDGREVENLVPSKIFSAAVRAAHPTLAYQPPADLRFGQVTQITRTSAGKKIVGNIDKVKVANIVVASSQPWEWQWLRLEKRVSKLVGFINDANGLI